MKSTVEQLTTQERQALALFYDTPAFRALKRLLELERLNTATKLLLLDPNTDSHFISKHQGRAEAFKDLNLLIKDNYKQHIRTEESNQKKRSQKS
jgi:hypothetical protein